MRGMTAGSLAVTSDATVRRMVAGDVIVEPGASVRITGMVSGRVVNLGGVVEVKGMVAV